MKQAFCSSWHGQPLLRVVQGNTPCWGCSVVRWLVPLAIALLSVQPAWCHSAGQAMTLAARQFLASLSLAQQAQTTFDFSDQERFNWHFIPRERAGLSLKEMAQDQRQLAYALLSSGLSHGGLTKIFYIMTLEKILYDLEEHNPRRDPGKYYVSIFGEPGSQEPWAWRVEGHHLSVNVTLIDRRVIGITPSFYGSHPAEVHDGLRQGLRVLGAEEDLARDLVTSLTPAQQKVAIIATRAPRDVINGPQRKSQFLAPRGLVASQMNELQREVLWRIIREYVERFCGELAKEELTRITEGGWERICFAWAGGLDPGQGHYYRVQGPTFIVEYDNTQNGADHVHAVWHDLTRNFGGDLLRAHYENSSHKN